MEMSACPAFWCVKVKTSTHNNKQWIRARSKKTISVREVLFFVCVDFFFFLENEEGGVGHRNSI